jgi:2-isopropylmalate synthase
MRAEDLIFDWNEVSEAGRARPARVELNDETLRDGLQSPSATDPPDERKIELVALMDEIGIDAAGVGMPGAGARMEESAAAVARAVADRRMRIRPSCAARSLVDDLVPIHRVAQRAGIPVGADIFVGSSPIRWYAEEWDLDRILRRTEESVGWAVAHGLPVMFITEDTTRSRPETLQRLYSAAIASGARRIGIADTVGHATPHGARALVRFVREEVIGRCGESVGLDWHGHRDRGLAVASALAAAEAGADRLHGCALGIGERCGNVPMELLLVNLRLLGWREFDLRRLPEYCRLASEAADVPIPHSHPVVGADAFVTGTGVHAAAVRKAFHRGDAWLADRIYSGVPASTVGRRQEIRVGPMSGRSSVVWWLEQRGLEPAEERVEQILRAAKQAQRLLEDEEIEGLLRG